MSGLPLSAILLPLAACVVEGVTCGLLIRKGLGVSLLSTVVRLAWGASQLTIYLLSLAVPGRLEAIFAPLMTHYWLSAVALMAWMWWDARSGRHELSSLAFRWLLTATVVSSVVPLLHHWIPTTLQAFLVDGVLIAACARVGSAAFSFGSEPRSRVVWLRNGMYRLEPQPRTPDYLVKHPELLLEVVRHSADPECRHALLRLLERRILQEHPERLAGAEQQGRESLS